MSHLHKSAVLVDAHLVASHRHDDVVPIAPRELRVCGLHEVHLGTAVHLDEDTVR